MPMPPMPTKWTRCFFSNIAITTRTVSFARQRVAFVHDLLRRFGPSQALRRFGHRRQPRAVAVKRADPRRQLRAVKLAVEDHLRCPFFDQLLGVEPLVIVGGVRIWDKNRRLAEDG